jgi:hypothetical protein
MRGKSHRWSARDAIFGGFQRLARFLNSIRHPGDGAGTEKGKSTMSIKNHYSRTLVAIAAAVAMSSVTVGAAVGPAQANAATSTTTAFAGLMKAPTYA